jgi:ATP synthase I chain
MIRKLVIRVMGIGIGLLLATCSGCWLVDLDRVIPSVITGGLIGITNFAAIAFLIGKMLDSGKSALRYIAVFCFLLKFAMWGFVIFLLIVRFDFSGPGIILGLTAIVVSTIISFFSVGLQQMGS